jgi:hypothetical protein
VTAQSRLVGDYLEEFGHESHHEQDLRFRQYNQTVATSDGMTEKASESEVNPSLSVLCLHIFGVHTVVMQSATKVFFSCSISLLVYVWASACGSGQDRECEKQITKEIHAGVSVETAHAVLEQCGFKTTMDAAKNTLYGDKKTGRLIIERTQVLIDIDSDRKVAKVTVTRGLVGP